tara:strand:- start:2082 stop:3755 length:1674 start_codon:yes stop_codon:yes gene_type:complete
MLLKNIYIAFIIILFSCSPKNNDISKSSLSFKNVTISSGLGDYKHNNGAFGKKWFPEPMGPGGGFIDYNGDGWDDLLLANHSSWENDKEKKFSALRLFENNQDGTFTDKTIEAGLNEIYTYPLGICAADYDNDGDQDFFLTTLYENMLFNNHNSKFNEVGEKSNIANHRALSTSAIFFDSDKDGWLDLYVGNYTEWSPDTDVWCTFQGKKGYCTPEVYDGVPSRFYRNNRDGTFTDQTSVAGFSPAPGKTLGVSELDFNKDGFPDLAVANDLARDLLYENNKDGTFNEIGTITGMAYDEMGKARAGMGIDVGVVDTTGEPTIFVGNFQNEMFSVYQYNPAGYFTDIAAKSRLGRESLKVLTFGMFLVDIDLDSDLDLFAINGHIQVEIESDNNEFEFRQLPQLFLNNGNAVFTLFDSDKNNAFDEPIVGRGGAFSDYDKDGDIDILLTENSGGIHLWRNDIINKFTPNNDLNYLRIKLKGNNSNQNAIGSVVSLYVDGEKISRRVKTGSSYLSQSEKIVTFGLGELEQIDSLKVNWSSGKKSIFHNLALNKEIEIFE